jgi:hypothetical protein
LEEANAGRTKGTQEVDEETGDTRAQNVLTDGKQEELAGRWDEANEFKREHGRKPNESRAADNADPADWWKD